MEMKCPQCSAPVSEADYFCPQCGAKLKEKPLSTSAGKQVGVYLLSFLLPPFGLWPAIRYLRQPDEVSKRIGIIAIALTAVSLFLNIWFAFGFINSAIRALNDSFSNLGI